MPKIVVGAPHALAATPPAQIQAEPVKAGEPKPIVVEVTAKLVERPAGFETPAEDIPDPKPIFKPDAESLHHPVTIAIPATLNNWRFVKNINPNEKVVLPNGEEVAFSKGLFLTTDDTLAGQIVAVAKRYSIVFQ